MDAAIVLVVGGFVTASAGWVFDTQREGHRVSGIRATLSRDMCGDLARAMIAYEGLAQRWRTNQAIDAAYLDEIKSSISTYRANKEWLGLFDNQGLSRAIIRYFEQSIELQHRLAQSRVDWTVSRIQIAQGGAPSKLLKADIDTTMRYVSRMRGTAAELQQRLSQASLQIAA